MAVSRKYFIPQTRMQLLRDPPKKRAATFMQNFNRFSAENVYGFSLSERELKHVKKKDQTFDFLYDIPPIPATYIVTQNTVQRFTKMYTFVNRSNSSSIQAFSN